MCKQNTLQIKGQMMHQEECVGCGEKKIEKGKKMKIKKKIDRKKI